MLTQKNASLLAALRTDPNNVRVLIVFGSALHLVDSRGQSPVHFAAETGHIESLRVLLATAWVSRPTPANCSCSARPDYESQAIKSVSTFGLGLLEGKDYKGRSALQLACRNGNKAHINLPLDYGANIDITDTRLGRSSLHVSIYWNRHDILSFS